MQDRFERFVVSITELHRYLQKLKELEMGQMDLKAGYTPETLFPAFFPFPPRSYGPHPVPVGPDSWHPPHSHPTFRNEYEG